LIEIYADFLNENVERCDHGVGICNCDWLDLRHRIEQVLTGWKDCDTCQGEGFVYAFSDEYGDNYDKCPTCGSKGAVKESEHA
jgi:DnaJ-class molecular chaperone